MSSYLLTSPHAGFDCFKEDLLIYLVQRFGSLDLGQKILAETRRQLSDDNILGMVGNPAVYLMGFALSVGLRMTGQQEDESAASIAKLLA